MPLQLGQDFRKHHGTQTPPALATCFGQLPGTPATGRAVAPGQHRDAPKTRRLGHGGLEVAVGALGVCAAPGPLVVAPLEFVLRAALPTPRRSPRAIAVAPGARPSEKGTGTTLHAGSSPGHTVGPSSEESSTPDPSHQPSPAGLLPAKWCHTCLPDGQATHHTQRVTNRETTRLKCCTIPLPVKEKQLEKHGRKHNWRLLLWRGGRITPTRNQCWKHLGP